MYCKFFGFDEKPFHVTPDTRYLYLSPQYEGVLQTLRFGIAERKGFLLLTGEVGTGKSISIRALLNYYIGGNDSVANASSFPPHPFRSAGVNPASLSSIGGNDSVANASSFPPHPFRSAGVNPASLSSIGGNDSVANASSFPPHPFRSAGVNPASLTDWDGQVETSLILNPQLSRLELLKTINRDFGQGLNKNSFKEQIDRLNQFVLKSNEANRNALVIIDEAQNLSLEALEMTRLLSNLETETHKLLQILLVGQPELEEKLSRPSLRQLRQRIQIHCRLAPLDLEETAEYIHFRLSKAGSRHCAAFEHNAIEKIHHVAHGIPRIINTVCDVALMAAYAEGTRVISRPLIGKVIAETEGEMPYVAYS